MPQPEPMTGMELLLTSLHAMELPSGNMVAIEFKVEPSNDGNTHLLSVSRFATEPSGDDSKEAAIFTERVASELLGAEPCAPIQTIDLKNPHDRAAMNRRFDGTVTTQ